MEEKLDTRKHRGDNKCWQCESLSKKEGMTQEELDREHGDCHGWYHCGDDCCGRCDICGR